MLVLYYIAVSPSYGLYSIYNAKLATVNLVYPQIFCGELVYNIIIIHNVRVVLTITYIMYVCTFLISKVYTIHRHSLTHPLHKR